MKRILLFLFVAFYGLGCSKDSKIATPSGVKDYNSLTLKDITDLKDKITYGSFEPKVGNVIIYKTSDYNYGKLKIVSVNEQNKIINFAYVTYDAVGKVVSQNGGYTISYSGNYVDLDTGSANSIPNSFSDFFFENPVGPIASISSEQGKLYIYSE